VTAAGPAARASQGQKEAACAATHFRVRRARYGAAPPASRVLRIAAATACGRPGHRSLCGPWRQEERAGQGLPRRARGTRTGTSGRRREMDWCSITSAGRKITRNQ
jgi:hypothetical protein